MMEKIKKPITPEVLSHLGENKSKELEKVKCMGKKDHNFR